MKKNLRQIVVICIITFIITVSKTTYSTEVCKKEWGNYLEQHKKTAQIQKNIEGLVEEYKGIIKKVNKKNKRQKRRRRRMIRKKQYGYPSIIYIPPFGYQTKYNKKIEQYKKNVKKAKKYYGLYDKCVNEHNSKIDSLNKRIKEINKKRKQARTKE